jgi:RNA polymerase-associated protein RTF1
MHPLPLYQVLTKDEWARYEKTLVNDREPKVSIHTIQAKQKALEKERAHIMTHAEIEKNIERKRELTKMPVNIAAERLRIKNELTDATAQGDTQRIEMLNSQLAECDEHVKEMANSIKTDKLDIFAQLNARNRDQNFREIREAEKAAMELRLKQENVKDDPFARRRTAPKHFVKYPNANTEKMKTA